MFRLVTTGIKTIQGEGVSNGNGSRFGFLVRRFVRGLPVFERLTNGPSTPYHASKVKQVRPAIGQAREQILDCDHAAVVVIARPAKGTEAAVTKVIERNDGNIETDYVIPLGTSVELCAYLVSISDSDRLRMTGQLQRLEEQRGIRAYCEQTFVDIPPELIRSELTYTFTMEDKKGQIHRTSVVFENAGYRITRAQGRREKLDSDEIGIRDENGRVPVGAEWRYRRLVSIVPVGKPDERYLKERLNALRAFGIDHSPPTTL